MAVATRKQVDMVAFMNWLPTFTRKFETADVQRQPRLFQAAIEYARSYTGSFAYMVEMKQTVLQYNQLTTGQAKGVLNCARAEALRSAPKDRVIRETPAPKPTKVALQSQSEHDARFQSMLDSRGLSGSVITPPSIDDRSEKYSPAGWGDVRDLMPESDMEAEARYQEMLSEQEAERAMGAWGGGFRPERLEQPEPGLEYDPQYSGSAAPAGIGAIENGTYTVVFDEASDDRITLRISDPRWMAAEERNGKQAISYLYGQDNENSYKGMAFLINGRVVVWRSVRDTISAKFEARVSAALHVIAGSDQPEMRTAYALASGRCARCGRTLTVPASLHRGVGPECAKYYDL